MQASLKTPSDILSRDMDELFRVLAEPSHAALPVEMKVMPDLLCFEKVGQLLLLRDCAMVSNPIHSYSFIRMA